MRGLLLALLVATPAAAYDGLYRPDTTWAEGWDCRTVGMDGGALAIQNGTFFGVENTCQLTNPVPVRDMDATLYDAICMGEGMENRERIMLLSTPGGRLTVIRGGFASTLVRCE